MIGTEIGDGLGAICCEQGDSVIERALFAQDLAKRFEQFNTHTGFDRV